MSKVKRIVMVSFLLISSIIIPIFSYSAYAGVSFTVALDPAAPSAAMQTRSTLNFIVTNTGIPGVDDPISEVKFRFPNNGCSAPNTTYYIANSAAPPSGWSVRSIKTECVKNKTEISFRESSQICGNGLAPGSSLTFGVEVTPYTGAADRSDDFNRAEAKDKWGCGTGAKLRLDVPPIAPWSVKGLKIDLYATPVSLGVGSAITVTATVTNMTNAAQNNILPGGITVTTPDTGAAAYLSGPTPASLNLASGASDTFTWIYTASNAGNVVFNTTSVGNGIASSNAGSSNTVIIGDLTASLNLTPSQVVTGQDVTVRMTVMNNGSSAVTNVTPAALNPLGTATTVCTGPAPASIGNLQPGQSGSFVWTCTISGIAGDTYSFSSYAASDTVTTNTAVSNAGTISAYAVVVNPGSVVSGTVSPASPLILQFTVYNNGGFPVNRVKITQPDSAFTSIDTVNLTNCPVEWDYRYKVGPPESYEFRACNGINEIINGGNKTFSLTFDGVPTVTTNTIYTFPVEIRDTNGGRNTVGVEFTVAAAVPVSDAVNFAITSGNTQSTLYWSPPSADYDGVLILRGPDAAFTTPVDGIDYTSQVGQIIPTTNDTVVYFDSNMTYVNFYIDTGLTNNIPYYYKMFNHNEYFIYSAGTALDSIPGDPVINDRQWTYSVGFTTLIIPTINPGVGLYSGSNGNNIFSMTTADGEEIWRAKETAAPVQSGIQIVPISGTGNSYIFASSQDGHVYAVDVATGSNVWTSPLLGDMIQAACAVQLRDYSDVSFQGTYTTDVVFAATRNDPLISSTNNKLYALDATSGAILWTFNGGGTYMVDMVNAMPVISYSNNTLVFASYSNGGTQSSVWAIDTLTGGLKWSIAVGDIDAAPSVSLDETAVYVGTVTGDIYALDITNGSFKWTAPFAAASPVVGVIFENYISTGILYFTTQDGNIRAIQDNGTGTIPSQLWQTIIAGASSPLPVPDPGWDVMYVGSSDGNLYELNLADGTQSIYGPWAFGSQVGDPVLDISSNFIFAGTSGGRIYSISP